MVITETCRAHWIIDLGLPYDGYYRNVSCTLNYWLGLALWWLFQKRVMHTELLTLACLMMVIPETCGAHWIIDFGLALWWLFQKRVVHTELLTLGLPYDGYYRNVSCTLNYWLGLALWWLLQKRVVHTELLTLGLPYDGYYRNVSWTLNYWLWACLMMVIPETCRAHWIIYFGLALWWLLQKRVVHTEL
jgi:hypothetical protein